MVIYNFVLHVADLLILSCLPQQHSALVNGKSTNTTKIAYIFGRSQIFSMYLFVYEGYYVDFIFCYSHSK